MSVVLGSRHENGYLLASGEVNGLSLGGWVQAFKAFGFRLTWDMGRPRYRRGIQN